MPRSLVRLGRRPPWWWWPPCWTRAGRSKSRSRRWCCPRPERLAGTERSVGEHAARHGLGTGERIAGLKGPLERLVAELFAQPRQIVVVQARLDRLEEFAQLVEEAVARPVQGGGLEASS